MQSKGMQQVNVDDTVVLEAALQQHRDQMGKEYKALDNLLIMREDGEIDKETFLRQKEIRETNIKEIK